MKRYEKIEETIRKIDEMNYNSVTVRKIFNVNEMGKHVDRCREMVQSLHDARDYLTWLESQGMEITKEISYAEFKCYASISLNRAGITGGYNDVNEVIHRLRVETDDPERVRKLQRQRWDELSAIERLGEYISLYEGRERENIDFLAFLCEEIED